MGVLGGLRAASGPHRSEASVAAEHAVRAVCGLIQSPKKPATIQPTARLAAYMSAAITAPPMIHSHRSTGPEIHAKKAHSVNAIVAAIAPMRWKPLCMRALRSGGTASPISHQHGCAVMPMAFPIAILHVDLLQAQETSI